MTHRDQSSPRATECGQAEAETAAETGGTEERLSGVGTIGGVRLWGGHHLVANGVECHSKTADRAVVGHPRLWEWVVLVTMTDA